MRMTSYCLTVSINALSLIEEFVRCFRFKHCFLHKFFVNKIDSHSSNNALLSKITIRQSSSLQRGRIIQTDNQIHSLA